MKAVAAPRLSRQYAKLCDRRDFDDPDVRSRIREIEPGRLPQEEVERKLWEYATLTLFMEDVGAMGEETTALAVGAGHETVLFWLANRIGRIVATDVYGEGAFAAGEADARMLTDPDAFAPYPFRRDHLEVLHMDARELEFADESFDFVFSLSSIEHFGSPRDVAKAAREIGRVLRPGGHAYVVTECFVRRHPLNARAIHVGVRTLSRGRRVGLEVFTLRSVMSEIVRPSGLELVQPLDRSLSPDSWANLARWRRGRFEYATGAMHPHVLLGAYGTVWTSIALAMRKPLG